MKRKVFAIAMSVALIVALVPLFGGAVLAVSGGTDIITEVPDVAGLAVAPGSIDFGIVNPGTSSQVPADPDRTINLLNTGNCNLDVWTEITGEERVVEGELLGHGDGSQTVFGPTDYTPIIEDSIHVYLDGVKVTGAVYTLDKANGLVNFGGGGTPMGPPAGGVLVSIDYNSISVFYSGPKDAEPCGPFDSLYQGMTLNDASNPPEILAREYARVLVDDQSCDPVAQIYVREDYPVGVEAAQIIFWAEYKVPADNPPTVTFQLPTPGEDFDVGDPVLIRTRNVDDWGVLAEEFVVTLGEDVIASGPLTRVSGTALDGIWEATWNTSGEACDLAGLEYTITVTATDAKDQTGEDTVAVNIWCINEPPTAVITAPVYADPPTVVAGAVTVDATIDDDVGIMPGTVAVCVDDPGPSGVVAMMTPVDVDPQGRGTYTATWDSTTADNGFHMVYVGCLDTNGQSGGAGVPVVVYNPPPMPAMGTQWVYEAVYEDPQLADGGLESPDVTVWTLTVTTPPGSPVVPDTYFVETVLDKPAVRFAEGGVLLAVAGARTWNSNTTLDPVYREADALLGLVNPLLTVMDYTYADPDHNWRLSVGKTWSIEEHTFIEFVANYINIYDVEVAAIEEVTVPAGTFSCYRLEYTWVSQEDPVGSEPVPIGELSKVEWWSTEIGGLAMVQSETYLQYMGEETQKLQSWG